MNEHGDAAEDVAVQRTIVLSEKAAADFEAALNRAGQRNEKLAAALQAVPNSGPKQPVARPSDALARHRQQVIDLCTRHHAANPRVFGSVARGEDTVESDLDLLVDFGAEASFVDVIDLNRELEGLLGCKVDLVSDAGISGKRREPDILRDAVPL